MKSFFKLSLIVFLVSVGLQTKAQTSFQFFNLQVVDSSVGYLQELTIVTQLEYGGIQQNSTEILQIGCQTSNNGAILTNVLANFSQSVDLVQPAGLIDVDTIHIPVNSIYFSDGGGHTVIVWPIIGVPAANIDSTTIGTITVTSWLSQQEWATEKQARIFPVPASDYLMLEKPAGKATITILDIQGRAVTTVLSNETQIRIPLTQLSKGNYFIRYSDGVKSPEIHSFIKQ